MSKVLFKKNGEVQRGDRKPRCQVLQVGVKRTWIRRCFVCGCSDQHACLMGCSWIGDLNLCTACVGHVHQGREVAIDAAAGAGLSENRVKKAFEEAYPGHVVKARKFADGEILVRFL